MRALPAVQDRSQQTRNRLLDAAEALLREKGPEKATVPAIARRARVAVGTVYRRFSDKDALLRGVYERFFARSIAANRQALADLPWSNAPLDRVLRQLVDGMVRGYRFHAPLLAALLRYVDAHPDEAFRRHAEAVRAEVFVGSRLLILARRDEISHPHPDQAVEFLFATLGVALKGFLLQQDRLAPAIAWPAVSQELQRFAVGYLSPSAVSSTEGGQP